MLERHGLITSSVVERTVTALDFWTLLCEEWGCGPGRDALATYLRGESLLRLLLEALCHPRRRNHQTDSSVASDASPRIVEDDCVEETAARLSHIEDSAVAFFRQYCWAHKDNSRHFAENLVHVLQSIGGELATIGRLEMLAVVF